MAEYNNESGLQVTKKKDDGVIAELAEAAKYDYEVVLSDTNRSHTKMLKLITGQQVVLEIGCATGYMTRVMNESLDCRVVAVEIDAAAARKAEPFCEKLIIGDIETLPLETVLAGWQFDVIMLADVVEHLKDPTELFQKLRPLLKDDGALLMSVPNGAHGSLALELLDGKWDYRDQGLLDRTHLHFFDKDSLVALMDACGFFISRLDRIIIHPRDTEMKTPWEKYPREVTAYLEKVNPEYQTYQYVVKAFPMSDTGWRIGLEDALAAEKLKVKNLEALNAENEKARHFLQAEYNGFQAELEKREKEYLANLQTEMDQLEGEKEDIHRGYEREIARLKNEQSSIRDGYEKEIERQKAEQSRILQEYQEKYSRLEAEKNDAGKKAENKIQQLHTDYQQQISNLEDEKEEIHRGYRLKLDQVGNFWKEKIRIEEEQRRDLTHRKDALARELETIHGSVAWRALGRYRRMVDRCLPPGTRRRRFYQLSVLAPVVLFKEGAGSFFAKIARRIPLVGSGQGAHTAAPATDASGEPMFFSRHEAPQVSIIIPVYNQCFHTIRCLKSLRDHTAIPYEIIVVDNASEDETPRFLAGVSGITVIRNERNYGFVEACNRGGDAATGDYLLFLNNDTEVSDGWLEAMIRGFDNDRVGIVGAKLVYPDGSLQEAGNVIWQDGTGWNYGRGDDPALPQYNYLKEVDYCSGACLMISEKLWRETGGFDMRYAPAYYEDTDLCFTVRAKGFKVLYQPAATVIHHEGATAGRDINQGFKQYQQQNLTKFVEKWQTTLEKDHFPGPDALYLARERGRSRRALVVDHYIPTYDKDSGSLRMYSLLKILSEMGYKVTFWPENRAYHERYALALQRLGIEVMYGDIHFDQYVQEIGPHLDLAVLSRPHIAIAFIHSLKAHSTAKIIYDTVDLHYLRETRRVEIEPDPERKREAQSLAREWKHKELFLANQSDLTLVVSPVEKEILEKEAAFTGRVTVVTNVHAAEACNTGFDERAGLMFIGGFLHDPNEDAVIWFVETIFPILRKQLPELHFTIVGSHPTERVKALASKHITVTGYVADVTPFFEKSRVFVSPLRYGAGVKGKIGQSMAYGLPVVTTEIGAEGMGLVNEVNAMITDDESTFAGKVLAVYRQKPLWEKLSVNGRRTVAEQFSPEVTRRKLERLLTDNFF